MRWLQFILFSFVFASTAQAQTTFSFSGLLWGDDPSQVENKLKTSGLSYTNFSQKLVCKVQDRCQIRFGDNVRGEADFVKGRLVFVWIFADDKNQYGERLAKLKAKYGTPYQCSQFPEELNMIRGNDPLDLCWATKAGETLQIISNGGIKYTSSFLNTSNVKDTSGVKF